MFAGRCTKRWASIRKRSCEHRKAGPCASSTRAARFMSFLRSAAAALSACALPILVSAADPKPTTNEPPRITAVLPFFVVAGRKTVVFPGMNLTNVTDARFLGTNGQATATIISKGKATVPDKADAKKVGDSQIQALV